MHFFSNIDQVCTEAEMFKLYLVPSFLSVCHMESSLPQSPELGKKKDIWPENRL